MARVSEAFRWSPDPDAYPTAIADGRRRIAEGQRKRDWKLDDEQRAEKNAVGTLGEAAFAAWCEENELPIQPLAPEEPGIPDEGDFATSGGYVIDVKTQDVGDYFPKDAWRCEVTMEQMGRAVDIYVFGKLYRGGGLGLLLVGWMEKEVFDGAAQFHDRGTFLEGRRVRYPKWDVTIAELHSMEDLAAALRR